MGGELFQQFVSVLILVPIQCGKTPPDRGDFKTSAGGNTAQDRQPFLFLKTHAGAEIDRIIDRGTERIGNEFKCAVSAGKRDWVNLQAGIDDGVIHKGFVAYMGDRNFTVAEMIRVVSGKHLLIPR